MSSSRDADAKKPEEKNEKKRKREDYIELMTDISND